MSTATAPAKQRAAIRERTLRKDNWRRYPIVTLTVFTAWLVYATVRAFVGTLGAAGVFHNRLGTNFIVRIILVKVCFVFDSSVCRHRRGWHSIWDR